MIKTGGANVAPREVELLLEALPEIVAHAVGVPHDPERGENVAAAIVLRAGATLDAADAPRAAAGRALGLQGAAPHLLRARRAELPMTDSGKLDRRKLRDALAKRLEAES